MIRNNILATNQNKAPSHSIGSYDVLELLGSGAFGSVYKVSGKFPVLTKNHLHACLHVQAQFSSPHSSRRRCRLAPPKGIIFKFFTFFLLAPSSHPLTVFILFRC